MKKWLNLKQKKEKHVLHQIQNNQDTNSFEDLEDKIMQLQLRLITILKDELILRSTKKILEMELEKYQGKIDNNLKNTSNYHSQRIS